MDKYKQSTEKYKQMILKYKKICSNSFIISENYTETTFLIYPLGKHLKA